MEVKKFIAVSAAIVSLASVGTLIAHAGTYGDANVTWSWGYGGSYAYSSFTDRVATATAQVKHGGLTVSDTESPYLTAFADFQNVTSGATFYAISSNYNNSKTAP